MASTDTDDVAPAGKSKHDSTVRSAVEHGRVKRGRGLNQPCVKCGHVHFGCKAHKRSVRPLQPCGKWPMHGATVCETHGGKAPSTQSVARVRWEAHLEIERAKKAVKTFGLPINISPQQALLDEIARTAGHVIWLGEMIGEMEQAEITWNKSSEEHQDGVGIMGDPVDLTTIQHQARPAVWVQLYQAERAHLVQVCKVAISCGIAERQVKLAEEQGAMIAGVLTAVFADADLGLTAIQLGLARTVASKHLRQLQAVPATNRPGLRVVNPSAVPDVG